MLKNQRIYFAILMVSLIITPHLYSQADSPYSRYGFGKLRDHATGPSKGMGGVGYGLHTGQSANPLNPASYAQVDSLSFIFDIGINQSRTIYKEGLNKNTRNSGGLDYVTMLFPVSKKIGVSLGVLPFSTGGYNLSVYKPEDQSGDFVYRVDHAGTGGLSQIYLGMGYQPVKGLSAGFNVSYLFGKLKRTNSVTILSQTSDPTYEYTTLNVTGAKIDLGLQYKLELPEFSSFTLGAVYSPKMDNKGNLKRVEYQNSTLGEDEKVHENVPAGIPHTLGVGVAYDRKGNLLLAADATMEKWDGVKFSDLYAEDGLASNKRFNNRIKLAAGAEYRVSPYTKSYFHKIKFRGGLNYSNSYINVQTQDGAVKGYNEYGASLGFGFPVQPTQRSVGRRVSYVNLTFEYKYLKPELSSMVSERYFGVSLNINMNELWFLQRKIN